MSKFLKLFSLICFPIAVTLCSTAQVSSKTPAVSPNATAEHAASLAESGNCPEALPLLSKTAAHVTDKELQKRVGLDGVRCATLLQQNGPLLEFVRILKPAGWLVLLWNERLTDSNAFLREYEELLLTYGTDYAEVRHERTTDAVNEFFDPVPFQERTFEMRQEFDYAGLEGRLLSSSYAPGPGHPKHEPMLRELRRTFEKHAGDGCVTFDYKTRVYFGKLK